MGSLIDELQRGEAAARPEAEELRGRIAELAERLAGVEGRLSRLVIARETVDEVLSEAGVDVPPTAEPQVTARPGAGHPPTVGVLAVPRWRAGLEASVLLQAYRDLVEVAGNAGRPLRQSAPPAAAGLSTDKARVEALRSKLKRLVERGWLAEEPGPGLFALPARAGSGAGEAAEASSKTCSPSGGGRCSGSCCKIIWTCGRRGRSRALGRTARPRQARTDHAESAGDRPRQAAGKPVRHGAGHPVRLAPPGGT